MDEAMAEKEQAVALIEEYTKLQRIKAALNRDEEMDSQIKRKRPSWKPLAS